MKQWNDNLFPPSGFEFTDLDGLVHRGSGITDLAAKLTDYRARRGLPIGNPAAEVVEQLCSKYPSRCHKGEPPSPAVLAQSNANIVASGVGDWLRQVWTRLSQRKIKWVADEVVKQRVAACLACPQHGPVKGDCPACQESLNTVSTQLRAGRDRASSVLRTCSFFKTDARVDVLIDQQTVADAPEGCWKRAN